MFRYKSYQEAKEMKERISNAILGVHDSVVSVATEEENDNNSIKYCVKIGLLNSLNNEDECNKILATLKNVNIISEAPDQISSAQKHSLFKHVGKITAYSNSSGYLSFLYSGSFPKRSLALVSLGAIGLAACAYKMTR